MFGSESIWGTHSQCQHGRKDWISDQINAASPQGPQNVLAVVPGGWGGHREVRSRAQGVRGSC